MVTVRFPDGFSVQYNDAHFLSRAPSYTDILTEDGGKLIAQAPNTCLIEFYTPCRMYNALNPQLEIENKDIAKELRSIKRKMGKNGQRDGKRKL